MTLKVVEPCWLIAEGDSELVEVYRSPLVRADHDPEPTWRRFVDLEPPPMYHPVRDYIAEHGLELAFQTTLPDSDWWFATVVIEVYTLPAQREAGLRRWVAKYEAREQADAVVACGR